MRVSRLGNLYGKCNRSRKRRIVHPILARAMRSQALLSAKEEKAYGRIIGAAVARIAKAKSRDEIVWEKFGKHSLNYFLRGMQSNERKIFTEMVLHNLRLVASVATHYNYDLFEIEDLIGYGVMGLMIAALRYDPDTGNKFCTYATHWVRHSICRSCEQYASSVRVPVHELRYRKKLSAAALKFEQSLGRTPTDEELSVASGVSLKIVKNTMANSRHIVSLNAPMAQKECFKGSSMTEFQDVIPDEHYGSSHEEAEYKIDGVRLEEAMQKVLSEKERVLFRLRFWDGVILQDIAKHPAMVAFQRCRRPLSRERIRQMQEGALVKLRDELVGGVGH